MRSHVEIMVIAAWFLLVCTGICLAADPMMIGWWKLDETDGTSAADSSGNSYTATLQNGLSFSNDSVKGRNSTGLNFDGSNDRVYASSATFPGSTNFTISMWIKPDVDLDSSDSRMDLNYWGTTARPCLLFDFANNGKIAFCVKINSTDYNIYTVTDSWKANTWYHIAGTYNGSTVKLYVNGILESTYSVNGTQNAATGGLYMGCRGDGANPFDGSLDDVRVYQRTLSAVEIAELAAPTLIGHWKLDETSGTSASDSSGYNMTGTLQNGLSFSNDSVRGREGKGLHLDGSNDRIDISNFSTPREGITMAMWIKPDTDWDSTDNRMDLTYIDSSARPCLIFDFYNAGRIRFLVTINGTNYDIGTTLTNWKADTWYHIAGVFDGQHLKMYVNGRLDSIASHPGTLDANNGTLYLGMRHDNVNPVDGKIDDVRIYAGALSSEDIYELTRSKLLGHWKLDETSGTSATDSSGNGFTGSIEGGASFTSNSESGIIDNALHLDGTNDCLRISSLSCPPNGYSVAFWFKPDVLMDAGDARTDFVYWGAVANPSLIFDFYGTADNGSIAYRLTVESTAYSTPTVNREWQANTWYHCVATFDGTYAKLYINGREDARIYAPGDHDDASDLRIGCRNDGANAFDGLIDDVRVYEGALFPEEVIDIYEAPKTLIGHWKLDETSGTTADDSSDNGNDGTLQNGLDFSNDSEPGRHENALNFDGSNDRIYASSASLPSCKHFTLSMWIKPDVDLDSSDSRMDLNYWGTIARPCLSFDFANNGKIAFCVKINSTDYNIYTATDTWNADQWYHIVGTYDGHTIRVYVNGEMESLYAVTGTQNAATGGLYLGCRGDGANAFDGEIDDVRIYTGTFTDSQVAALYAQKPTIYYFDTRYALDLDGEEEWDVYQTVFTIQGLVNREAPRLFVNFLGIQQDRKILEHMLEDGGLCEGWQLRSIDSIEELIKIFRHYIEGVILYDDDPTTAPGSIPLVATTAAACENALPLRKDTETGSMYNYLVNDPTGPKLPVLIDLVGKFTGSGTIWGTSTASTGSKKCDPYIWAKERYLDTGKCDPTVLVYTLDYWGLRQELSTSTEQCNLDYAVKRKAFVYDLSPWGDEKPNDDTSQPLGTDLDTYKKILNACNTQTSKLEMIKTVGFVDWTLKYTNYDGVGGSHSTYLTEWEYVELVNAYNCYVEATFNQTNGSFFSGFFQAVNDKYYVQNPAPSYSSLQSAGYIDGNGNVVSNHYVLLGMGDYDGTTWPFYKIENDFYQDSVRGSVYCNWAIDPQLCEIAGPAFDYFYRHKTSKDFFIGWDSGCGYVNPSRLHGTRAPSYYPSIVPVWQEHCKKFYRMFDYSITGWLLNGTSGSCTNTDIDIYLPFSGDGIGPENCSTAQQLRSNTPAMTIELPYNPDSTDINNDYSSGVVFDWYRTVIWEPTDIQTVQNSCSSSHKFLDAYTFYYLMRHHLGGNNNTRVTYVSDTVPRVMEADTTYSVSITVRNDGWDVWTPENAYRLSYCLVAPGETSESTYYSPRVYMSAGSSIGTGQQYTFTFNFTAPSQAGEYIIYADMVRDGVTWFRTQNNLEWTKDIIVAADDMDVDTDGDGIPDITEHQWGLLYWNPDDREDTAMAFSPEPQNKAQKIVTEPTLMWSSPLNIDSFDIYFGTNYNNVSSASHSSNEFKGRQSDMHYKPGTLSADTTYYWAVDTTEYDTTCPGEIWQFKVKDGPVMRLTFDETASRLAHDDSGQGHSGALLGGLAFNNDSVTGMLSNALHFDGSDDRVRVNSLELPEEFTMSMWVKPDVNLSSGSSRQDLLYWGKEARPAVIFNMNGDGKIGFHVKINGTAYDDIKSTTTTWSSSSWYHVTVTYDGTYAKLYINGSQQDSETHSGSSDFTEILYIGSRPDYTYPWDGRIDDVRVYNWALTSNEVSTLYQER